MFEKLKRKKAEKTELDKALEVRIDNLSVSSGDTAEDAKAIENLERLTKVKGELEPKRPKVNPNVVLQLAATVGLGVATLHYEKLQVVTSKVFGMVTNNLPKFKG